jgi:2-desacetyl-2-hydroxyethyl bacteriochlorophyllide A dehydrogenase
MQSRAARWYGPGQLRLEDVEVRPPASDEALVRIVASGICGSDVHAVHHSFDMWEPPVTLGHEGIGTVEEPGRDVVTAEVGDLVAIAPSLSCGSCTHCREGEELLCSRRSIHDGALADFATVPGAVLYPIPEEVPWRAAVLVEPLSCVLHAVSLAGIRPGEWVAVVGAGPVGLLAAQVACLHGAYVLVSEPNRQRRQLALSLGADAAVDPEAADPAELALELTAGVGIDRVIEAAGAARSIQTSINLARRGGTVVLMGVASKETQIHLRPYDLYQRELTIRGSFIRRFDFQRAVRMLDRLRLEELVTDEFALERVHDAIGNVAAGRGVKTVVRPSVEEGLR